jgi:S1-C subfamily serine protease
MFCRNSFYNFSAPQQTVSHGSGFIIEGDGLIVTNAHVVLGQPNSSVQVNHYGWNDRVNTV